VLVTADRRVQGLIDAAGDYLTRGLSVIALSGKTPNVTMHKGGLNDALIGAPESEEDWQFVARFFAHKDTTGIGIVIPYPYVVVDIDGEEGAEQWMALVGKDYELDAAWVAKTPRLPAGGLHLWYTCATPTGSIKLGSKLDLKGQLSYVAAPPSLHPDGGTYKWLREPGDEPVMEAPEALTTLITYHATQKERRIGGKAQRHVIRGPRWQPGDHTFYAQSGFDGVIAKVKSAEEGNRNAMLYWAAATIAEEGGQGEDFEKLAEAALAVGLEREETKRTIRSAGRLGA